MKQTGHFNLNLVENTDVFSVKPLNENAEKIDAVLLAQQEAIAGKLMMAAGTYVGNGKRKVTIQTPGFKPQVMMLRQKAVSTNTCWWLGQDADVRYGITAASNSPPYGYEPGEQFSATIETTLSFVPATGALSWSIPAIPSKYYDVTADGGPSIMNNSEGTTYEWIAFGVAE